MSKSKKEEKKFPLTQKKRCSCCSNELDNAIQANCSRKVNHLQKCKKCEIKNPKWPVVKNPFDFQFLNTGWDGNDGALLAGVQDLHWEIGMDGNLSGPSSVASWALAKVIDSPHPSYKENLSNAKWVSFEGDGNSKNGNYVYYKIKFYIEYPFAPLDFAPKLNLWADNKIEEIYVNGIKQSLSFPSLLPQTSNQSFRTKNSLNIILNKNWKKCENEIIIKVYDDGSKTGLLIQSLDFCKNAKETIKPELKIKWGSKKQECLSPTACEIMCVTVCNPYSNVVMTDFKICQLEIYDVKGNLIDPTTGREGRLNIVPNGVLCYGDVKPCSCVSREIAIHSKSAKKGEYKMKVSGICYGVKYCLEECFTINVCGRGKPN